MAASHSHEDSSHKGHSELGHVLPFSIYVTVLVALLALTVITVAVSRIDFGPGNFIVAMLVASIKALLVALFFMHLKYENPATWLYAFFPILLIGFFLGGIFIDNPFRIDARTGKMPSQIEAPTKPIPEGEPAEHHHE